MKHKELYCVEHNVDILGMKTTMNASVIAGSNTPLLISKKQLGLWQAIIHMDSSKLELVVNGRRITFITPESKAGLQLLPIHSQQLAAVGVNLRPGEGCEVNMLLEEMPKLEDEDDE